MNILGLETSTAVCSVGLFREGQPGVEHSLRESHIHSEKLLTLMQEVMKEAGIGMKELDAIAVSIGPGSFTGLRIGLSTAKGLSYALDKPLVAVSTFGAIAEAARRLAGASGPIAVLIDAKKEEWYVGRFLVADGSVREAGPVEVRSLAAAASLLKEEKCALILTDKVDQLSRALDIGATIEDVHTYCRGDVVASLGYAGAMRQEFADAPSLEPMYLKDFVIRSAQPVS
ncbi:MAG: tRNA (adenosine(37)-N6)-threonylcarbamoyltransferase complex dimerization subunit type 1 TsaB [Ignavibacteriales bacterium]|nr:tRNA (adenosine(37)-N6)-threonylcarbamoyltransferase complex dimerization subunit type 1 TsaB [Ignavibacteriales bacterium]